MFHSRRVQYWILTHAGHETTTKAIGITGAWHLAVSAPSGWWLTYPSEKYESQLGWWHSQCHYMQKTKLMFQTTNKENPLINDEKHTPRVHPNIRCSLVHPSPSPPSRVPVVARALRMTATIDVAAAQQGNGLNLAKIGAPCYNTVFTQI